MMAEAIRRLLQERGTSVEVITAEQLLNNGASGDGASGKEAAEEPDRRRGDASWGTGDGTMPVPAGTIGMHALRAVVTMAFAAQPEEQEPPEFEDAVTIAVDAATNSLIVLGSPRLAERVAALVEELQAEMPPEPSRLHIIEMPDGANARAVADVVRSTVRSIGPARDDNPGGFTARVNVLPDPDGTAIIVAANDTDFATVRDLVAALARPGAASDVTVKIYPLTNVNAQRAVGAVRDLFSGDPRGRQARRILDLKLAGEDEEVGASIVPGSVRLTADPSGSSLIAAAPPEAIPLLDRFIGLLDQAPVDSGIAIRRFELDNARAQDAARVLQTAFDAKRDAPGRRDTRAHDLSATTGPTRSSSPQPLRSCRKLATSLPPSTKRPQMTEVNWRSSHCKSLARTPCVRSSSEW